MSGTCAPESGAERIPRGFNFRCETGAIGLRTRGMRSRVEVLGGFASSTMNREVDFDHLICPFCQV